MSKKLFTILLIIILALLVALGIILGMRLASDDASGPSRYSAVYLSTGDVYFGEFSRFPFPHMKNAWYLQRGTDAQNMPQLAVAPLRDVFWGPTDKIRFNPADIVFSVRLRNDSSVVQVMEDPTSVPQISPAPELPQTPLPIEDQNATSTP